MIISRITRAHETFAEWKRVVGRRISRGIRQRTHGQRVTNDGDHLIGQIRAAHTRRFIIQLEIAPVGSGGLVRVTEKIMKIISKMNKIKYSTFA